MKKNEFYSFPPFCISEKVGTYPLVPAHSLHGCVQAKRKCRKDVYFTHGASLCRVGSQASVVCCVPWFDMDAGGFCRASALVKTGPQPVMQCSGTSAEVEADDGMRQALVQLKTFFGYNSFRVGQVSGNH